MSETLQALAKYKKHVALGLALALAVALLIAGVNRSWFMMTAVVAGLGAGLGLTLFEVRRARAVVRELRQRARQTDQRLQKLVAREKSTTEEFRTTTQELRTTTRELRRLKHDQVDLRRQQTRLEQENARLAATIVRSLTPSHVDLDSLAQRVREHQNVPFEVLSSADDGTDADEIIEQGWKIGSHPRVKLDEPIDWLTLCRSNRSWNFRLHSWDFMGPVLRSFEQTGEIRYLMWCVNLATSWATEFTAGSARGTMAWYDMALGLRGHRLGYVTEQVLKHGVDEEKTAALIKCVVDHQKEFIAGKAFSTRNNHGAYVALGELALARRLPEMPGMDLLATQGRKRADAIVRRQFAADGGHREHSPEYHRKVLATFRGALDAGLFSTDDEVVRRLERAEEVLGWFIQPNGELVQIGDSVARLMRSEHARSSSLTTEFLISGGRRGEPDTRSMLTLPESGYAIVRSPSTASATDQEQSAHLVLAAGFHSRTHKHADDLAITWFDRGTEILIDAGRYGYVDPLPEDSPLRKQGYFYSAPERQFVESTRAHNTIEADGRDHERRDREPYGSAIHHTEERDGRYCLRAVVDHGSWRHDRTVILCPGEWLLVRDAVNSEDGQPHDFRLWWNLPGKFRVTGTTEGIVEVSGGELDETLFFKDFSDSGLIEPATGMKDPMRGWRSKHDLELSPAWSTGYEVHGVEKHYFQTLFIFGEKMADAPPEHPFE